MAEKRINGVVQGELSSVALGSPTTKTLATGVLVSGGNQNIVVVSESGAADALTQITGLAVGELITISPESGDTITVTDGANLNLQGVNFVMDDTKDKMLLLCTATGVCDEVSRASNN